MFEQINNPFAGNARQFADAALKANSLAFNGFEQLVNLQLKAFEDRFAATAAFIGEASEVRDPEGFKALLPKTVQLAKDNLERAYHVGQEILGQTVKTQEAIAELVKTQFEAFGEEAAGEAKPARKAAANK